MLLAGLLVTVASAAPPRIEPCREKYVITVETAEPVLDGERTFGIDSCGSGLQYSIASARTHEAIAHVSVDRNDGRRVHLRIDNLKDEIVLERRDLPLDEAVTVRFADNGRAIDARVFARKVESPSRSNISIHAVDQPLKSVLRELQAATGWKIGGIDALDDQRVTFRMDEIAIVAVLTIASEITGTELVMERDGEAALVPRKDGT